MSGAASLGTQCWCESLTSLSATLGLTVPGLVEVYLERSAELFLLGA